MFSVPSVVIQKKYECEESPENPEFVMHCKKFLLASVSCPGLPSFGFFQELQNTVACTGCQKPYFYLKKIEKKKEVRDRIEGATSDEVFSISSDSNDEEHADDQHADSGSSQNECFCPICYVRRFCNVHTFQNHDGSETHYIFKEKSSGGGILYQSSPIIERFSGSVSGSD
jgi:hypothetical protein